MGRVAFVGDLIWGKHFKKNKPSFHLFMCDLSENLNELEIIAQDQQIEQWYLGHFGPLSRKEVLSFINRQKKKYE